MLLFFSPTFAASAAAAVVAAVGAAAATEAAAKSQKVKRSSPFPPQLLTLFLKFLLRQSWQLENSYVVQAL